MPRTTVDLDSELIAALKRRAAANRESMSRVVARLVREGLARAEADSPPGPLLWRTTDSRPAPGFDPADRGYLDLLDEDDD